MDPLVPYEYAYLVGSLYFLIWWVILFISLPQHRRLLWGSGFVFMFGGIAAEYFWWTKDWWHPITITGTRIGIEDFIMSFTHIGLGCFVYKFFFVKENTFVADYKDLFSRTFIKKFLIFFCVVVGTVALLIHIFQMHSFLATSLGLVIANIYIVLHRRDLISPSIVSGVIFALISLIIYWIGSIISPGVIEVFWDTSITGITLLGAPVEDLVWYFLLGLALGGSYEFFFDSKIVPSNKAIGWRYFLRFFNKL